MKKNNNKGAAMVNVLICITFISIIASSLLYMTYINYLTKAARYNNKNNFYSGELALDEVAVGLENVIVQCDSANKAKEKINTDYTNGSGKWDATKLATLINVASSEPGAAVSITSSNYNYIEDKTGITFEDVKITSKYTNKDNQTYESSIETDIFIGIAADKKNGPDVNDFSVITDSLFKGEGDGGTGGCITLTGNVYAHKDGSGYAMDMKKGMVINMLSPLIAIDGNIKLSDGSALIIAGDAVVDGNIELDNDCTLIVIGSLGCSGTICGKNDVSSFSDADKTKVKGIDRIDFDTTPGDANKYYLDDSTSTLGRQLYTNHLCLADTSGTVRDIGVESSKMDVLTQIAKDKNGQYNNITTETYSIYDAVNGSSKTVKRGTRVECQDTVNANDDWCGKLIFYTVRGSITDEVQLKGSLLGSTILSLRPIRYAEREYCKIDKMDDEAYAFSKELIIPHFDGLVAGSNTSYSIKNDPINRDSNMKTSSSADLATYFPDGLPYNAPVSNAASNFDDMRELMLDKFVYKTSDKDQIKVWSYTVPDPEADTGSALTANEVGSMTAKQICDLSVDDETRYVVTYNGQNVLPYGYLLSPYSQSIIGTYFSSANKTAGKPSPSVQFKNWDKVD